MSVPLQDLIAKYAGIQCPRYTSYPTAVEFQPTFHDREWKSALQSDLASRGDRNPALALYFHIPFCRTLCFFCACNKVVTKNRAIVAPYLAALRKEIDCYATLLPFGLEVEQLHWGGGTPNYLTCTEITELYGYCRERFPNFAPDADVSIELDPRTTSFEQLVTLREIGFTRLSFGVQDFDSAVQRIVNRIQPYTMAESLITSARELGFSSIGIDLIYGLPGQTLESFGKTLAMVKRLRPDRISLFGYAHVTWKSKAQASFDPMLLPNAQARIALLTAGIESFLNAGYKSIGMDHFALPEDSLALAMEHGTLNRNFMGFSTHKDAWVIGCGASAVSSIPGAFAQNSKDLAVYQRQVNELGLSVERGVVRTRDDQLRSEIIEKILCGNGVDIDELERHWKIDFWEYFASTRRALLDFVQQGLITLSLSHFEVTEIGRLFARNIAMVFDAYLPKYRVANSGIFSQSV